MINLSFIKDLCKNKGITLKKLAEDIQISQTGLTSAIKNNGTTLETLDKIAKYFNVSVGVFFGEHNNLVECLKNKVGYKLFDDSFTFIVDKWVEINPENMPNGDKYYLTEHINYGYTQDYFKSLGDNHYTDFAYKDENMNCFLQLFEKNKAVKSDFVIMRDNGLITQKCCLILSLWARDSYDLRKTLVDYEKYLLLKDMENL